MPVVDTEGDFVPTRWRNAPSERKPRTQAVTSPAEADEVLLRGEITVLLKAEKDCQFDLGRLFKRLRDEHARGRNGKFLAHLRSLKTSWKKADRLIKFYERELRIIVAKRTRKTALAAQLAAWGIEDVQALDQKLNSQAEDDLIAARKLKLAREKERIEEAKERQKQRAKESAQKRKETKTEEKQEETAPQLLSEITIKWALSYEEFEIFKEAWLKIGDEEASIMIFKAVTDAVAARQGK